LFFGLQLIRIKFEDFQHPAIQTILVEHFGGVCHQIEVRQPIGNKDSTYTSRLLKSEEIGDIFVFKLCSKIQDQNKTIKNL
jgi:hypothetical protein